MTDDGRLSTLQELILLAAAPGRIEWRPKVLGIPADAGSRALRRLVRRALVRAWTRDGTPCPPGRRVRWIALTPLGELELPARLVDRFHTSASTSGMLTS